MSSASAEVGASKRWRHHDLERLAGPDLLLAPARPPQVVRPCRAARRAATRPRDVEATRPSAGVGAASSVGHPVQPADRVGPGLIDALVGVVVVDRVGDRAGPSRPRGRARPGRWRASTRSRAVRGRRRPARAAARAGAPRRTRRSPTSPPVSGGRSGSRGVCSACEVPRTACQRVSAGRHADRRGRRASGLPVALGQRRPAPGADERVARPDPAVLGRLQQEGARPAPGQLR